MSRPFPHHDTQKQLTLAIAVFVSQRSGHEVSPPSGIEALVSRSSSAQRWGFGIVLALEGYDLMSELIR